MACCGIFCGGQLSYLHWYACGVDGRTVGLMGVRSRDYQKFLG